MWGSRVRISSSPPKTKRTREGVLHFCLTGEIRTIPCNGPVDRCPSPAGRRWLHSVSNLFKSTKNEGAVRKVCRCEPVTAVTGVAAPRLNGNRLVLLPRCLKIRGIATPACALVRNDGAFSNSPFIFAWLGRFEPSHATVRWTVAHRRLDGDGSIVFRISSSPPVFKGLLEKYVAANQ